MIAVLIIALAPDLAVGAHDGATAVAAVVHLVLMLTYAGAPALDARRCSGK